MTPSPFGSSLYDEDEWHYRIAPMGHVGWYISIVRGLIGSGPNGGPYLCFGSRKRAIRKATRLVRRRQREDERTERLTFEGYLADEGVWVPLRGPHIIPDRNGGPGATIDG